jgi:hypothetical protein
MRTIMPTPIIKGKDAVDFLKRMESGVITPERLEWLKKLAEESKRSEETSSAT